MPEVTEITAADTVLVTTASQSIVITPGIGETLFYDNGVATISDVTNLSGVLESTTGARTQTEPPSTGTVHTVTSVAEWNALVDSASSPVAFGDTIEFAAGTYDMSTTYMRIYASGVLVKPASGASVTLQTYSETGQIYILASDITWYGFTFEGDGEIFQIIGDNAARDGRNLFYGNTFNGCGNNAQPNNIIFDNRSSNNEFRDNTYISCGARVVNMTVTAPPGTSPTPENAHFHHNTVTGIMASSVAKLMGCGGGVWQDWNAPYSGWSTKAIIEYNRIDGWNGNAEIGAFKASDNIFRYNYITNSGATGGRMNVRQGGGNLYYGNHMDGCKIAFASNGDGNRFIFNYVGSDAAGTGFALATDSGDETLPIGRETPATNNVISHNVLDGFFQSYTPTRKAGGQLNALCTGNQITDNYWIFPTTPTYTPGTTGITESELQVVNTISIENYTSIVAAKTIDGGTCCGLQAPYWWPSLELGV
jgi:hypothetical protein